MRRSNLTRLAVLALLSGMAHLTAASQFKISGDVLEAGTGRPVSDVAVKLVPDGSEEEFVAATNAFGAFEFPLEAAGDYTISVSKAGYLSAESEMTNPRASITLDAAHPARTARFALVQTGSISGTVLDDLTRKPVQNLSVTIVRERLLGWQRTSLPGGRPVTDAQGRFFSKGLAPGRYFARTTGKPVRILQPRTATGSMKTTIRPRSPREPARARRLPSKSPPAAHWTWAN